MAQLPTGTICLWYGAIGNIPGGFVICDGNNGTPNLKNKFIVGAGDTYAVDDTGGAILHNHAGTTNGHAHTTSGIVSADGGGAGLPIIDSNTDTFTTDNTNGLPPYHSLAYIMKT